MAHPWIFESNFEAGTNAEWDSESDTGSLLDFPHYSTLARLPGMPAPYRGAYCMRIQCGDTNDHTLTEGDIDIADAATAYFRWYMFVHSNFTATADDIFNVFELQQAGGTIEMSVSMQITAATNLLEIGFGDGAAQSSFVAWPGRNRWVCVELLATVSTVGAGVATLFLDGTQVQTATSLTQGAAVGQGVLGTQNTLATTTGAILFDQFTMDDGRLYPHPERFPMHIILTKSQHVFVGPGAVEGATLLTNNSGDAITLYDTDTATTNDAKSIVTELVDSINTSVAGPLLFNRGCYAKITGSSARAEVYITTTSQKPGLRGPVYHWSDGAIKRYGTVRKSRVQNA